MHPLVAHATLLDGVVRVREGADDLVLARLVGVLHVQDDGVAQQRLHHRQRHALVHHHVQLLPEGRGSHFVPAKLDNRVGVRRGPQTQSIHHHQLVELAHKHAQQVRVRLHLRRHHHIEESALRLELLALRVNKLFVLGAQHHNRHLQVALHAFVVAGHIGECDPLLVQLVMLLVVHHGQVKLEGADEHVLANHVGVEHLNDAFALVQFFWLEVLEIVRQTLVKHHRQRLFMNLR
mmetsp:Transcript_15323/g.23297  ORF Transcript_15323/g.23297 Transcript_15323/m.23297 type:complete len:235 (-) Transcript_15323:300-1004(-)